MIEPFGAAIYLSGSYFDHSCQPNATAVYTGRKLEIVAMKDIEVPAKLSIHQNAPSGNDDVLSNVSK